MREDQIKVEFDDRFYKTRFEHHRNYISNMWMLGVFIVGGLWEWDWVVDSVHAPNTIWLRVAMALGALSLAIFYRHASRRAAVIEASFSLVLLNVLFYATLTQLQNGMVYGIGGFMFTHMAGLVVLRGFSFWHIVFIHIAATLAPHAMGLAFPATGFQHAHYAALVWPATFMAVIAHYGLFKEYVVAYSLKDQLHHLAEVDSLTGAFNRRAFNERALATFAMAIRHKRPMSVMMLDLDHFKTINDTHGHTTGDRLLIQVARTIQNQLRKADILCRWGGEEFLVVMPEADSLAVQHKAEQLCQSVARELVDGGDGQKVQVTVSIGVAHLRDSTDELKDIIQRADSMMYRAKNTGRNRVCISES